MGILISIATAFLTTMMVMPIIIKLFRSIDLMDIPDKRKIHSVSTPSLGGIAIFLGVIFSILVSNSFVELASHKYFIAGTFVIFLLGIRDDLSSLMAKHKLVAQIFAAVLVVYLGGWKIYGFNGLFGIDNFPYGFNEIFTIFVIVVMTNAFNLIDGIDGLAGSIALVITLFFSWYFLTTGYQLNAALSMAISGAVLAFLLFNWYPSKVFMGDTGSMTLGFMISSMLVQMLAVPESVTTSLGFYSPVSICIALLILPVYDTLRVFFIRFYLGKSPLAPDRNHIHHILLKLGMNHGQSTIVLISYNVIILMIALLFQHLGDTVLILSTFSLTVGLGAILNRKVSRREAARTAKIVAQDVTMTKSA